MKFYYLFLAIISLEIIGGCNSTVIEKPKVVNVRPKTSGKIVIEELEKAGFYNITETINPTGK